MSKKDKQEEVNKTDIQKREYFRTKLVLFDNIVNLSRDVFMEIIQEEIEDKAGNRYSHTPSKYARWGSNPGSIQIGEEKVPIEVPRLMNKEENRTESPESYKELRQLPAPTEKVVKKVALGLSQKDYGEVTRHLEDSFSLSQSSVSRKFREKSKEILEGFLTKDLSSDKFLVLVVDGKSMKKEQVIIALGITADGVKKALGFIQSTTENSTAIKGLFRDLIERGFHFQHGILVVIDGATGLRKAVRETFGKYAVIQRCQWHKRENVISYLNDNLQPIFSKRIQNAYSEPDYQTAQKALEDIALELGKINISAANSLREGMEETLTLKRLGLGNQLAVTLSTTNTIENVNGLIEKHTRKIKRWTNSYMLNRWVAVALHLIEPKLLRIPNYRKLHLLGKALQNEIIKNGVKPE
jgi:putative transposase